MISLPFELDKTFYKTQHKLLKFPIDNAQWVVRQLLPPEKTIKLTPEEKKALESRFERLLEQDIKNVKEGMYPESLLFQLPIFDYIKNLPTAIFEITKMYNKLKNNKFNDLPDEIDREKFPKYFLRNFHWQSDGYFSDNSAKIYDLSVELIFWGGADIMRRQMIPHITKFLQGKNKGDIRLLDVACGTARFLRQLTQAHPEINIYGIDLSPYYINFARKYFKDNTNVILMSGNAENIEFENDSFDIVTSVYLFHELPMEIRQKVFSEMYRVIKPGGLLVIEDSVQLIDGMDIENAIYRFAKELHEPFYKDYVKHDLELLISSAGFKIISSETHGVAKVVAAMK